MATIYVRSPHTVGGIRCNRDRLATAILLFMEPDATGPAVANALQHEHGIERREAIQLTIAARWSIDAGIEP